MIWGRTLNTSQMKALPAGAWEQGAALGACGWGINVRPETIKLLEENIGRTFDDINQSKILYDPPLRVTEIKTSGT